MVQAPKLLSVVLISACIWWAFQPASAADVAVVPTTDPSTCSVPDVVAWGGELQLPDQESVSLANEVRIVVLGSSSTAGSGATQMGNSFVSRLSNVLAERTSLQHRFHVVNAGIGGETTADMLLRLRRDVLDTRPGLVIWQTGTNDAIKGVPLVKFRHELAKGLAELRSRSIPVVLVDQQDVLRGKPQGYDKYVSAIRSIARQERVTLLHRYRVMEYLSHRRSGGLRSLLADDGLHMNDYTHRCVGDLLAAGIGRILG